MDLIKGLISVWPDFKITQNDISHPTTDFVCSFFRRFLADLHEDDHRILELLKEKNGDEFDCNILEIIALYKHVGYILETVGLTPLTENTFTLSYLMNPNSASTKYLLMVISNFIFYCHNMKENKLKESYDKFMEKYTSLQKDEKKLNHLNEQMNESAVESAQLEDEKDELLKNLGKVEERIQSLESDIATKMKEEQNFEDNTIEVEQNLLKLLSQEKNNSLEFSKLIVNDSEQLNQRLKDLEEEIVTTEQQEEENSVSILGAQTSIQHLNKFFSQIKTAAHPQSLQDILMKHDKEELLNKECQTKTDLIQNLTETKQKLNSENQLVDLEIQKIKECQANLDLPFQQQNIYDQELAALHKEMLFTKQNLQKSVLETNKVNNVIAEIEVKCEEHDRDFCILEEFCKEKYQELLEIKSKYYATVNTSLENVKQKEELIKKKF